MIHCHDRFRGSIQRLLKPSICALHLKHQLSRFSLGQFFLRPHPVQANQPADNLRSSFEIFQRDLVYGLYELDQQRVQSIL